MGRYPVTLYTNTCVFIEAGSPKEAEKIALERTKGDEWWIVHRQELQFNLEPVSSKKPLRASLATKIPAEN